MTSYTLKELSKLARDTVKAESKADKIKYRYLGEILHLHANDGGCTCLVVKLLRPDDTIKFHSIAI